MPRRLLVLAFWGAVAFSLVMASLPHPPQPPGHPSDKIQHVLAFATMTALGIAAYPALARWRLGVGLSLFGVAIEIVQLIPALQRDSDWRDWLADSAAIAAVLAVAWLMQAPGRRQPRRRAGDTGAGGNA